MKKQNRAIKRMTAIYAHSTVNLNNEFSGNPQLLEAVNNNGDLKAIPNLSKVRGFILRGVFYIEQWYYNEKSVYKATLLN